MKKRCTFIECWHYGICLFTDTEGKRPTTESPEINPETEKPKCYLSSDWYKATKKKEKD